MPVMPKTVARHENLIAPERAQSERDLMLMVAVMMDGMIRAKRVAVSNEGNLRSCHDTYPAFRRTASRRKPLRPATVARRIIKPK